MNRLLLFALINFVGAMSPGPDFAVVTRYGMTGSRKCALYATLGICAALVLHVIYCLTGVTVFLQQSPILLLAIQLLGAIYLGYLAITTLFSSKSSKQDTLEVPNKRALYDGFFTNLLNPKATIFILSLFVQFVDPADPLSLKLLFGIAVPLCASLWFVMLSYFLTHPLFSETIQRYQRGVNVVMGVLLLALSLFVIGKALTGI